ncbi:MAG: hypothetical protein KJN60_11320 [Boseongicola sp.]|nr:hypothetical protein [Boseongicola sp.]
MDTERYGNHAEVCAAFKVNERGIITSPGKFEGEPTHAVYFWEAWMNGSWDDFDGDETIFNIDDKDRHRFPALEGVDRVRLWQSEQGFVYVSEHSSEASSVG